MLSFSSHRQALGERQSEGYKSIGESRIVLLRKAEQRDKEWRHQLRGSRGTLDGVAYWWWLG